MDRLRRLARLAFPHGHPQFTDYAVDMMFVHDGKNQDYAGGGPPLGNFERCAEINRLYPNLACGAPEGYLMQLVLKHFDAIMWSLHTRRPIPTESAGDIAVYMNILRCMARDKTVDAEALR